MRRAILRALLTRVKCMPRTGDTAARQTGAHSAGHRPPHREPPPCSTARHRTHEMPALPVTWHSSASRRALRPCSLPWTRRMRSTPQYGMRTAPAGRPAASTGPRTAPHLPVRHRKAPALTLRSPGRCHARTGQHGHAHSHSCPCPRTCASLQHPPDGSDSHAAPPARSPACACLGDSLQALSAPRSVHPRPSG